MVTNLTWLGISLVMVVEQSIGTGFNRFIAKYIELAFGLPSYRANVITGKLSQNCAFTNLSKQIWSCLDIVYLKSQSDVVFQA